MYKKIRLKYIILGILIIICICWIIKFSSNIEIFNTKKVSNDKILICIGDSILNNEKYVPVGKSVINYLQNNMKVINLAQDNAKILDVYNQLRRIPHITSDMNIDMNIIMSIGGNNLLEYDRIETVHANYVELVNYITQTYKSQLYVLNLYYPTDESMTKYYTIINKWNSILNNISSKYNIEIIDISTLINKPTDLVKKIEPSITGGLKISDEIIRSVK